MFYPKGRTGLIVKGLEETERKKRRKKKRGKGHVVGKEMRGKA